MLYLGSGARQVEVGDQTLYLFPDFSDPRQFYVLPNFPHLAKSPDGSPAISLLVFREDLSELEEGEEEAVAFLSLDVDLSWDPDVVQKAANQLQLEDGLTEPPRLTPIFFREGSARLLLLDAATPDPDAGEGPDEARPTEFVAKILGASQPSLYGDNRAIFQARLSKKGAVAMMGALEGLTPIGVVYSLTFAGLQPAFDVRARVDWDRVYEHMSEQHSVDALFVGVEIQDSIDQLVEERAIEIDVTIEGIGDEAMDAHREEAMKLVRRMIFEQFFELSFDPETAAGGDVGDVISELHGDWLSDSVTLGTGYTFRRKELKIEQLRTLDVDWTARKATTRQIYPQAHMHTTLRESGVDEDDRSFIRVVGGGEDALWKTVAFRVTAAAPWESDGIAAIQVYVEFDDPTSGQTRSWSTTLDPDRPTAEHREWMDRADGSSFRYRYEVIFAGEGGVPGPAPTVGSGELREQEGTILVIHPRELYASERLEVGVLPGFSFARWPTVQAALRYRTDDGSFVHQADGLLTASAPMFATRFRVDRGVSARTELRLSYFGVTGQRVELPWMPMETDHHVVEDPHPSRLTVRAIVAGRRENIANLIVDLEYTDEANGVRHTGAFVFDADDLDVPQEWSVHLADPTKRRYRYRMTLVTTEGEFIQTGWIHTDAPTLPVGEVYVRRLHVEVVVAELGEGIEAVEILLAHGEPGSTERVEQRHRLGGGSRVEWVVQLPDASQRSYELTVTWVGEDGFDRTVGPQVRSDTLLVIPGSPPEGDG